MAKNPIKSLPKNTTCKVVIVVLALLVLINIVLGSSSLIQDLFGTSFKEGACSKTSSKKKQNLI
tara:strand:- start:183 stop:374 length:192 start_codon:yes stop_codon:yes gene_type:complete